MNYILCGFKNCGKTSVGKLLAKQLEYVFVDVDDLIHDHYPVQNGVKLRVHEIYKQVGETEFRAIEKRSIQYLADIDNSVIATGGGSVLDPENAALFKKLGKIFYLHVEQDVLQARLRNQRLPAFLATQNPERTFAKLYEQRLPVYRQVADIEIDASDKTVEEIAQELMTGKYYG
jgi:shikimate kinase